MSLKIKSVEAKLVDLGLTKPYKIAYKTIDSVEILFVEITAENGQTGLGAANTNNMLFIEGNSTALNELNDAAMDILSGRDLRNLPEVLSIVHGQLKLLAPSARGEESSILYNNFYMYSLTPPQAAGNALVGFKTTGARTALDIALHDLYTKNECIPLVSHFGQKHRSLPTSVTIGIMGIEETLNSAREFIRDGFKILKVKLGTTLEEDMERIIALKTDLPAGIKIRIDANQGWDYEETLKFYRNTKSFDIELIEQPSKVDATDRMRDYPDKLKGMIAADESLYIPSDAERLAKEPKAAGIFNIKLMKCGGVSPARQIAEIAGRSGIDLMWGCNDESAISISAALHTALACPGTKYLDLDGSFDLASDIVTGGFILENGALSVSGKPGLGVEKKN